jgi:peroxiredoxin
LVRVYNKYKERGFTVIGVALQSEDENIKEFVKKYRVPYAIASDTTSEVGLRYQVFALPSSFLFTAEGKVKKAFMGYVEEEALERELQTLVGQSTPPQEKPQGASLPKSSLGKSG